MVHDHNNNDNHDNSYIDHQPFISAKLEIIVNRGITQQQQGQWGLNDA